MADGSGPAEGAAFAQALSGLKTRGSNLLVVGGALESAHAEACDRLLGDATREPRRRVFVQTDGTSGCGVSHAETTSESQARLVVRETETRSASATAEPSSNCVQRQHVVGDDLGAFAAAIVDAIDALEPATREFDPGELRLCFDSLVPLFADHEDAAVFELLNLITARVRQKSGMGHYHLPVAEDTRTVALLEPQFDAVITLRVHDGRAEHNWQLLDRDVESGWLPL